MSQIKRTALIQPLTVGYRAPELELESLTGELFRLSNLRGKKVLLSFLRNAQCALCNLWVATTSRVAERWRQQGLEVVAVFESSAQQLRTQFEGRVPPFAVLADPSGEVHDLFSAPNDPDAIQALITSGKAESMLEAAKQAGFAAIREEGANFFRIPTELLLHADGTVAVQHVALDGSHLHPDVIARFLGAPGVGGVTFVHPRSVASGTNGSSTSK